MLYDDLAKPPFPSYDGILTVQAYPSPLKRHMIFKRSLICLIKHSTEQFYENILQ